MGYAVYLLLNFQISGVQFPITPLLIPDLTEAVHESTGEWQYGKRNDRMVTTVPLTLSMPEGGVSGFKLLFVPKATPN